jgi:peptidoglycan/xylan/chitin deacetylase (PgdA/CDA1 family)
LLKDLDFKIEDDQPMFPPIIMLHHVEDFPDPSYRMWCISRNKFLELLNYLNNNSFQSITFSDIVRDPSILRTTSKKVILTFDDCSKRLLDYAVPELVKRNMKASFYIPTANIGKFNSWNVEEGMTKLELMNESDLKELNNLGMEVGSHSHFHAKLKEASPKKVREQFFLSKEIIENIIGSKVYSFAFPYASIPSKYEEFLSSAGYEYGLSIYQPFENKYALRRFGYWNKDTEKSLRFKLSKRYKLFRMMYDPLKKY